MITYNLSTTSIQGSAPAVNTTPDSLHVHLLDDLNAREDRLLRIGNGIRDEVVFPRLFAAGLAECDADAHRTDMRLVRQVQYGLDTDGAIAAFLGVVRCWPLSHGTIAASEVV